MDAPPQHCHVLQQLVTGTDRKRTPSLQVWTGKRAPLSSMSSSHKPTVLPRLRGRCRHANRCCPEYVRSGPLSSAATAPNRSAHSAIGLPAVCSRNTYAAKRHSTWPIASLAVASDTEESGRRWKHATEAGCYIAKLLFKYQYNKIQHSQPCGRFQKYFCPPLVDYWKGTTVGYFYPLVTRYVLQ